jgi:hypothetical protein
MVINIKLQTKDFKMINFIKILRKLYQATKGLNRENEAGDIRIYNCVETDKLLYIVVSKEVCKKYGLNPDIRFVTEGGNNE